MPVRREDCLYTAHFCEENVWQLLRRTDLSLDDAWAVFITNESRTCALFQQRASAAPEEPVVWDYHVILVGRKGRAHQVFDLDSRLAFPTDFRTYAMQTFLPALVFPEPLQPKFRIVPGGVYQQELHSDRSHMKDKNGAWRSDPPPWDALLPDHTRLTLGDALDLTSDAPGDVVDVQGLLQRWPAPEVN